MKYLFLLLITALLISCCKPKPQPTKVTQEVTKDSIIRSNLQTDIWMIKAQDGHDYLILDGRRGTTIIHAAGCKKCNPQY